MGLKLVIVDDAPFIREAIKGIIQKTEHIVVGEATNGFEAVELAKKAQPDVIIMDLVMPEKNGIEATKEILSVRPETIIIACSTVDEKKLIMQAMEAGCKSFLTKPFEGTELMKIINKLEEQ